MNKPECSICQSTKNCRECNGTGYRSPEPIGFQEIKYATGVGNLDPTSIARKEPIFKPLAPGETLPPCKVCHGTGICQVCKD